MYSICFWQGGSLMHNGFSHMCRTCFAFTRSIIYTVLVPCSLSVLMSDPHHGKGEIETWDAEEFVPQVVVMQLEGGGKFSVHGRSLEIDTDVLLDFMTQYLSLRWVSRAAEMTFQCGITTYLCYSPTCTPAQLSLLSEAIAKYSAFLKRKEKKNLCM